MTVDLEEGRRLLAADLDKARDGGARECSISPSCMSKRGHLLGCPKRGDRLEGKPKAGA